MDYGRLKGNLEKRFGGQWTILVRLHPSNLPEADGFFGRDAQIVNATYYGDMQGLLAACDVLVTDYSSSMFDFSLKGKPCFLYATDVGRYRRERGCYFEFEGLPFPLAQSDGQLEGNILSFDEKKYREGLERLFASLGYGENGNSSELAADYIEQWIKSHWKAGTKYKARDL